MELNQHQFRPTGYYNPTDEAPPPGPFAGGLVNLMRENHWSAQPQTSQPRDLNSLITRTAGDVDKLGRRST